MLPASGLSELIGSFYRQIYMDKDFIPKGVMVEYYNVNFIKHHDLFKNLSSQIFKGKKKIQTAMA